MWYNILASDPVCRADAEFLHGGIVEGGSIHMWCTVKYNGNCDPEIERNISTERNAVPSSGFSVSDTLKTLSPAITMQLTSSDNGVTFTWKTSFKPPSTITRLSRKSGEVPAANVPHYQHLWNFKANVFCKYA